MATELTPRDLVIAPGLRQMMIEDETARELFVYLGGARLEQKVRGLLARLPEPPFAR